MQVLTDIFILLRHIERMKMKNRRNLTRRSMMLGGGGTFMLAACACSPKEVAQGVSVDGSADPHANSEFRSFTEEQWKEKLSPASYFVLFEEGTERPWTSPLNDEKRAGTYHCIACDLPLFESVTKYDSRTGWPSFYDVIEENIGTKTDYKIGYPRTEYHCARCLGHQGHLFPDGPAPTGLRYCNNGVALTFKPKQV